MLSEFSSWVQGLSGAWPELLGSLVGSAIGLISLVLGALYNARLNRNAEREKEVNDRFGIVEALIAEISSVKNTLDKATENIKGNWGTNDHVFIPDPCPDRGVFDKFLSRIELFDEATIRGVCDLYAVLGEYCTQALVRGAGFDQSVKGRGLLVVRKKEAELVIFLNEELSRRSGDVASDLRFQRIQKRHAITREFQAI